MEAEDVFASLAIPLMKLVGLKTTEMATEGRFTAVIIQSNADSLRQSFGSDAASGPSDRNRRAPTEEIYPAKAALAGKLVMERQKDQLIQLVRILKQIEAQVNARRSRTVKTLARRRLYLREFFRRAIHDVSAVDHVDHRRFQVLVTKLLREAFEEVGAVLGAVEADVEDLLADLGEQMCGPMVEYVQGVRADLRDGCCVRLVGLVEEMAVAAREARAEVEAAREKAVVAEARRVEALSRLREAEDNVSKLKEHLGSLLRPNRESTKVTKAFAPHKLLDMEKEQANDEKLLWGLLEKKRKYQTPESPIGLGQLIPFESANKRQKSAKLKPQSVTRTYSLRPRTPRLDARVLLGSSPTVTIQQAASGKPLPKRTLKG